MATFFGFTEYEEVIGQLGVDSVEFTEATFNSMGLVNELQLDLLNWFPAYAALSSDTSTDVAVESQKLAMRIYCKVFCAYEVLITAPLKFVQQIGDGDNATRRFQHKDSLNDFKDELLDKRNSMKLRVLSYQTAHSPTTVVQTVVFPGMAIASPSVDKITG